MASLVGQQLGPYTVLAQMGSGGMATVYRAHHPRLDRDVAIKMLHEAFQEDQNFLARFEREAQIVARLDHPHIVPVFDFDEYNGRPYLVMKYIEGQTLKALLDDEALTLSEILALMPPIADALDYAHRQGVLHRDIKPSNVIIDGGGIPYLTDFGLARMAQLGESTLSHDVLLGTPHYISPEQAMGSRDLDSRTDLYSLGVVLYELVVGRVPFSADTPFAVIHDHIYRALPKPSDINPEITPKLDAVLEKALAKQPADRFETATAMINAFRSAVESSGVTKLNPDRASVASESLARHRTEQNTLPPDPIPAPVRPPAPPRPRDSSGEKPKRSVEASFDFSNAGKAIEQVGATVRDAIENFSASFDKNKDPDMMPIDDPEAIRRRVEERFKKRNEFVGHLIAYIMVNGVLWAIFGSDFLSRLGNLELAQLSGGGFPWPLIVLLGWGAGLAAHAIETYFETGRRAQARLRTIHAEFYRAYGERWHRADRKELKVIRDRVTHTLNKRREFFQHFAVYMMINLMLWMIYIFSSDIPFVGSIAGSIPFPWPILVTGGWGIGLVINAFDALTAYTRESAIQRAVEREQAEVYGGEKPKREPRGDSGGDQSRRVRLTEDGEFTDSMIEEIERENEPKRSRR